MKIKNEKNPRGRKFQKPCFSLIKIKILRHNKIIDSYQSRNIFKIYKLTGTFRTLINHEIFLKIKSANIESKPM